MDNKVIEARLVTVTAGDIFRLERENALLRAVAIPAQQFREAWHDWHEDARGTGASMEEIGLRCRTAYKAMCDALDLVVAAPPDAGSE